METIRMRSEIENDGHVRIDILRKKYDFSDLAGQLKWAGDPVAEQRSLRDYNISDKINEKEF